MSDIQAVYELRPWRVSQQSDGSWIIRLYTMYARDEPEPVGAVVVNLKPEDVLVQTGLGEGPRVSITAATLQELGLITDDGFFRVHPRSLPPEPQELLEEERPIAAPAVSRSRPRRRITFEEV